MKVWFIALIVIVVLLLPTVGTYNSLVSQQEAVRQSWSQVQNVYQRRLDLIPNLVATVKGYAAHEQQTFVEVTQARSQAAGSMSNAAPMDPAKFKAFQDSQAALSGALGRLMVVVERYPDLKANQNFLSLQTQLEGTENRISVERRRFNETAQTYNIHIRQFPAALVARIFAFTPTPYFEAEVGADKVPEVKF
jgi:LemA protein